MTPTIEAWDEQHPRWPDLNSVVAHLGQTNWVTFTAEFHLASHVLVALCGDEIAGFLRYVRQPIGPDSDCPPILLNGAPLVEAKILAFGVVEVYRRQGIGRALQIATIEQARRHECYQIRSHSSGKALANHHLKLSLGFAVHPTVRGEDRQGAYFILPLQPTGERSER